MYLLMLLGSVISVSGDSITKYYRSKIEDKTVKDTIHFSLMVFVAMIVFATLSRFNLRMNFTTAIFALLYSIIVCVCVLLSLHTIEKAGIVAHASFSRAGGILWSALFGVCLFGEALTKKRIIGIILALCAVIIPSIGYPEKDKKDVEAKVLCFLVFLVAGTEGLLMKYYLNNNNVMPQSVLFFYANVFVIPFVIFMIKRKTTLMNFYKSAKEVDKKIVLLVAVTILMANISSYIMTIALKHIDLIVYSMLSPTFTIMLSAISSRFIFKETFGTKEIVSIILLIGAVVVMAI